jgi:DNA-binding transcriptional regulator of glucitol operon
MGRTFYALRITPDEKEMSETLIIAILAIAVVYLLMMANTQRKRYKDAKRRIKDRAWRRDD